MPNHPNRRTLPYKVHDAARNLFAATQYAEDAAAIVPEAGIIMFAGRIVWREGEESQPAAESYDHVANVILRRSVLR